jgi:cell division protein FtsW (lipid II flippase)
MGFVAMFAMEHIHYKYTRLMMVFIVAGSVILAILTPLIGINIDGAIRGIRVAGGVTIQAAEPCKLASAMLLAYVLSRFQKPDGTGLSTKGIWWGIVIVVGFVGLLVTQGGSNALLVLMVGGTMMILSVLPRKLIFSAIAVVVIIVAAVFAFNAISSNKPDTPAVEQVAISEQQAPSGLEKAVSKFFGR